MITTQAEHNSVLRPLYRKEKEGAELTILPVDKKGNFSLEEMEKAVRENTVAVICTHASNVTGNLFPGGGDRKAVQKTRAFVCAGRVPERRGGDDRYEENAYRCSLLYRA